MTRVVEGRVVPQLDHLVEILLNNALDSLRGVERISDDYFRGSYRGAAAAYYIAANAACGFPGWPSFGVWSGLVERAIRGDDGATDPHLIDLLTRLQLEVPAF